MQMLHICYHKDVNYKSQNDDTTPILVPAMILGYVGNDILVVGHQEWTGVRAGRG
jgi:hypothetical protein